MLTGRLPFTGGNTMALLLKHVTERPKPIAELRPDAPRGLREIVERALMKAPEDRWPTADSLRDALAAGDVGGTSWRAERREPVRYASPVPARPPAPKRSVQAPASRAPGEIVMEPEHLAALTPEQRTDLRLWHGRVHLTDRIKAARGYFWLTLVMTVAGFGAIGGAGDVPPLVLGPLVPLYMARKLWLRTRSLRQSGVRARRLFLMPRAKWVLPSAARVPTAQQLEKLAPREVLDGPHGSAIRRAAADRAAIAEIAGRMSKGERAMLPELEPTVDALVERVSELAQTLQRLEESFDPGAVAELDARISGVEREIDTPEGERRLALLRRQRDTLDALRQRRAMLARQLDNAGLALGNLRLDLVKFRASGLPSAFGDVSTATQEARALSREISAVLDAADEVKSI